MLGCDGLTHTIYRTSGPCWLLAHCKSKNWQITPVLLLCTGMMDQLGFRLRGTTDAALVLTQAVEKGVSMANTGARWLWRLMRPLEAASAGGGVASCANAEAAHLPNVPNQPSSSAIDAPTDEVRLLQTCLAVMPSHNESQSRGYALPLLVGKDRCMYLVCNHAAECHIVILS